MSQSWKIKLKDDNNLKLILKFHKEVENLKKKNTRRNFEAEFKDNTWVKMNKENH